MATLERENENQEYVSMDSPKGNVPPVSFSTNDERVSGIYDTPREDEQYDVPGTFSIPRQALSPQRNPLYDDGPYSDWNDDSQSNRQRASESNDDVMESSYSEIPRSVL
jgi:hypothetical protein